MKHSAKRLISLVGLCVFFLLVFNLVGAICDKLIDGFYRDVFFLEIIILAHWAAVWCIYSEEKAPKEKTKKE